MRRSVLASLVVLVVALSAASCSKDPAVVKKQYLEKGNKQFEQKQYHGAIIEYQNALQIDARLPEARVKLAESYEKLGDSPNALREYVRAADLLPNDADLQVKASAYLLAAGLVEDAATRAQNALNVKPGHIQARLHLALATAGLKGLDAAVQYVDEAIKMDPSEPKAFAELGRIRLAQGDIAKAEKAFKSAYEIAPNSVDTLLGLANFYMSTERPADAEQWLKKAAEVSANDVRVTHMLAGLYMQTNRAAEAEAPLKAYADASPDPSARLVLADYYLWRDRKGDAKQVLEALQDDPRTRSESQRRLSIMEFIEGRIPEASKLVDEALVRDPKNAQLLLLKGRYLLSDGKNAEAVEHLKQSVAQDAQLAEGHYWLGVALRTVGEVEPAREAFARVQALDPREIGSKLQMAQMALFDGKADAALDFANQAVAVQPGSVQARLGRIDALLAKGDLPAALSEAANVAANTTNLPQPYMQLGRIYLRQGNNQAAEKAFMRAAELSGNAYDAVGAVIDARIAMGKLKEARTLADQALQSQPKNSWLHVYDSRIYKASKDAAAAEKALQTALSIDATNLEAYLELTRLYAEAGRLDEVRTQLDAIVAREPRAVWAHTMIAISYELQNRPKDARERYLKILDIDSRSAMAANNLAMIYLNEGENLETALQLAQTAVQQMPNAAETNDTLGLVYMKRNLPALAAPAFRISESKDPGNPVYSYHLGLALAQSGDKARARAALERALAGGKPFEGDADARRMLGTL